MDEDSLLQIDLALDEEFSGREMFDIPSKVQHLWSLLQKEYSPEAIESLLEPLLSHMLHVKYYTKRPNYSLETIQQISDIFLKILNQLGSNFRQFPKLDRLNFELMICVCKYLDSKQAQLIYEHLIKRLRENFEAPRPLGFVSFEAFGIASLELDQVLRVREAFDLILELAPIAAKTFDEESARFKPENYQSILDEDFHGFYCGGVNFRRHNYPALVNIIYKLMATCCPKRYCEHIKSLFRNSNMSRIVTSDLMVHISVLMTQYHKEAIHFDYLHDTMLPLMAHSKGTLRGHIVFQFWCVLQSGGHPQCNPAPRRPITKIMVDDFITRDDDLLSDHIIVDFLHNQIEFVNLGELFAGKEKAILDKIRRIGAPISDYIEGLLSPLD
jgi:hypothetical protein